MVRHYLTLTPLINAKILERVSLLGGLEGNKARSFVYEKFLVDYVKSFRGAFSPTSKSFGMFSTPSSGHFSVI